MLLKSLLAITLAGFVVADGVKLARTYPDKQSKTYIVSALNKEREFKFDGTFTYLVEGPAGEGLTKVKVTCPSAEVTIQGNVQESQSVDTTLTFDAHGLPTDCPADDAMMAVLVTSLSGFMPATDVEVGKSFPVKWAKGGHDFQGSATLEKIEEKEGKKTGTIKLKAEFTPSGETPGILETSSEVDLADGSLITSTGNLRIGDEGVFEIAIKAKS